MIKAMERKIRSFIWIREEKCHGSQCLMVWEQVLRPQEEGGLGVKDIEAQNHCLLMKFIHKLHSADSVPWKTWFFSELHGDLGDGHHDPTFLGCIVQEELNRYRAVTQVRVRDGCSTSF